MFLVFAGLPSAAAFLLFYVPRKLGYPRIAKFLLISYTALVGLLLLYFLLGDKLFTKSQAIKLVEEQDFTISDEFELVSNSTISAIGDFYHTFKLQISAEDKAKAIATIRGAVNFKAHPAAVDSLLYLRRPAPGSTEKVIQNYETPDAWVREYLAPPEEEGYAPIFRRISIQKSGNELIFQEIVE